MGNFGRALRLSLRYRWSFVGSLLCATIIGLLWGGNIGALYPVVEVVLRGNSLHEWADEQIAAAEARAEALRGQLAAPDPAAAAPPGGRVAPPAGEAPAIGPAPPIRADRGQLRAELAVEEARGAWYRRLRDPWIRDYAPTSPFLTLLAVLGVLLAGTVVKGLFTILHQELVGRISQLAAFDLRKQFFRRALRMDMQQFHNDGNSELMSRFTYDMENLSIALFEFYGKLIREPLKMLVCLAGAAMICWQLLVFSLLVAPLAAWAVKWLAGALKRANRKAMEEISQMYGILDETFQGIKIVKAFTMERYERRRFHHNSKQFYRKWMRINLYDSLTRPVTELLGIVTISVALLAGAYLVLHQETHLLGLRMSDKPLSLGTLLLFYGLLIGVSDPARKLSEVFSRLQRGAAAADRIYHWLDREPSVTDPPRPQRLPRHHRELTFDRVTFRYDTDRAVLDDVSLRIGFGETVAIVGPNGCGKTTLASLVPRFFDPASGTVRLDGIDLREVRLRDLRSQIGLVSQESTLFDDTVYNNIRYGSQTATRAQVLAAAERAHAHRFIEERLEQGYETLVGPRGNRLSGGQRQRIALARAILRDPAVLILDEATSQVDLESEQVIQQVLEQFVRNRTTILITHRLATLALADRIVVMNLGRIVDTGTHDELIRRCDLYSRLYDLQFRKSA